MKRNLIFLLLLVPTLSTFIGDQPLYDSEGSYLGTVADYSFSTDTTRIPFDWDKNVSTTYYDAATKIWIRSIPYSAAVTFEPDNTNSSDFRANIILTRVVTTGGQTYEEIVPYDVDAYESYCYNDDGSLGQTCSLYDYVNILAIDIAPDIVESSEQFYLYIGGSLDMARIKSNSSLGIQATQYYELGSDMYEPRLFWDTSDKRFYSGDGEDAILPTTFDTFTDFDGTWSNVYMVNTAIGLGYDEGMVMSTGGSSCTGTAFINNDAAKANQNITANAHIQLLLTDCNILGMGANTGSIQYDFYPNFMEVTLFPNDGTPSTGIIDYAIYPNSEGGGGVYTAYYGDGNAFGTTFSYKNSTYAENSTAYVYGYWNGVTNQWGGSSILGIPYYDLDTNAWDGIEDALVGGVATVGPPRQNYIRLRVKSTLSDVAYMTYYRSVYHKQYSTQWGDPDDQADALGYLGGVKRVNLLYSMNEGVGTCENPGPDRCNELEIDENTGYQIFTGNHLVCSSNTIGYTDLCGDYRICTYCPSCERTWRGYECSDGDCWGEFNLQSCYDGSLYIVYSCIATSTTEPLELYEDCLGAGCYGGYCGDTSQASDITFTVYSHLDEDILNGVNVTVTGQDPESVSYTTNCTTSSSTDNSCTITIMPGRWNFTGSLDGFQTGAGNCEGPGIIEYEYASGCSLSVPVNTDKSASFNLLATGQNENSTKLDLTFMWRKDTIENVSMSNNEFSISEITDNNGKINFIWNATSTTFYLNATKTGYTSLSNYALENIQIGKKNSRIVLMDKDQDLEFVNPLYQESRLIDYMILPRNSVDITFNMENPGTMVVTREDVLVRPCEDFLCQHYQQQGLNVMFVYGPRDNVGYLLEDGLLRPVYLEDIKEILWEGDCDTENIDPLPQIEYLGLNRSIEVTRGTFYGLNCEYSGTDYTILWSQNRPEDTDWLTSLADRSLAAQIEEDDCPLTSIITGECVEEHLYSPDGKLMLGTKMLVTTFLEFLQQGEQDIVLDYIIFKVNPDAFIQIIADNNEKQARSNGVLIKDLPINILVNPIYSPLVGWARDPQVLDNGIVSSDYRLTNINYTLDSYSDLPGLESVDWEQKILKGTNTERSDGSGEYQFRFSYPTTNLVKDVIFDIKNERFDTADVEYFKDDYKFSVPGKTSAQNFKIQTYLRFDFIPEDYPTNPIQTEFVRVDIPYRTGSYQMWMIGFAVLIAATGFLSLVHRSGIMKLINKGRRGRRRIK